MQDVMVYFLFRTFTVGAIPRFIFDKHSFTSFLKFPKTYSDALVRATSEYGNGTQFRDGVVVVIEATTDITNL